MEQTAKWRGVAEEIRDFTNNASIGLLSGTGRAEWALYNPTLGVGVPLSRAQALSLTPAEVLQHHFGEAEAGRQRGPPQAFNTGSSKHASTALVHMTGGAGGRHGEVPIVVGDKGQSLLKAQGLRAQLGRANARAPRVAALIEDVLPTFDDVASDEADGSLDDYLADILDAIPPLPPMVAQP